VGFLSTELMNGVTHGVGFLLSIAGLVVLVVLATSRGGARHIVACSIYGSTLIILYLASTLYHSVSAPRAKPVLRLLDHIAIYLLIAGTYTPFTLLTLRGGWGWSLFGVIWGLALLGSAFKILFIGRFPKVSVVIYLAMGWMALVAVKPMLAALPTGGLWLILAGGAAYTVGVVFYAWESIPHHHAIWHVFVMLGSASHFFAVILYTLPPA
jgi:hemolysin III